MKEFNDKNGKTMKHEKNNKVIPTLFTLGEQELKGKIPIEAYKTL